MLKFDAVLAGGINKGRAPKKLHIYSQEYYNEKVKVDADKAIRTDSITDRGPKLNKCLAVTQEKFEAESEEVKEAWKRSIRKQKRSLPEIASA